MLMINIHEQIWLVIFNEVFQPHFFVPQDLTKKKKKKIFINYYNISFN